LLWHAADELLVMQWRVGVEALVPSIQLLVEVPDVRKVCTLSHARPGAPRAFRT
jgi:hypothetical protein